MGRIEVKVSKMELDINKTADIDGKDFGLGSSVFDGVVINECFDIECNDGTLLHYGEFRDDLKGYEKIMTGFKQFFSAKYSGSSWDSFSVVKSDATVIVAVVAGLMGIEFLRQKLGIPLHMDLDPFICPELPEIRTGETLSNYDARCKTGIRSQIKSGLGIHIPDPDSLGFGQYKILVTEFDELELNLKDSSKPPVNYKGDWYTIRKTGETQSPLRGQQYCDKHLARDLNREMDEEAYSLLQLDT